MLRFFKNSQRSLFSKIGLTGSIALFSALAIIGLAAPRKVSVSQAENCTPLYQNPVFNPYPLTFADEREACKDYPLITGRLTTTPQYPQNQTQQNAGVTNAAAGSEVYGLAWVHNGAIENGNPNTTTARNVKLHVSVPNSANGSLDNNINVTVSADNASSLSSSFAVHSTVAANLEIIPGTVELYDHNANLIQAGLSFDTNGDLNLGNLNACFNFAKFIRFKVRVVQANTPQLTDNAVCINPVSVPATNPGQPFSGSVSLQNTGTTTWTNGDRYSAKLNGGANLGLPDQLLIPNASTVPPGASRTFNFNGTAPQTPGTYSFSYQMAKSGVVFGAICSFTVIVGGAPANVTLSIDKQVRNVSEGTQFSSSTRANTGNTVEYKIVVTAHGGTSHNTTVTDNFPSGLAYVNGSLTVNGQPHATGLTNGINFGDLGDGQSLNILFRATVTASGPTTITNIATAHGSNTNTVQDSANVVVAQVNNPVVCAPSNQNVTTGQAAYFTATGGNGQFTWSAPSGSPSSGNGASFTTSYSTAGNRTVTVTSAGSSDTCNVEVNTIISRVVCTPDYQTVNVNQQVYFIAVGGNGQFTWSAPGGNPGSGNGSNFNTSYSSSGQRTVTVTSGGISDTCSVQVNPIVNNQVVCNPSFQNVNVNQPAYFTATGGNGQFTWSAPGGNPGSGNGSAFTTWYSNSGSRTVTVTSNGSSDTCNVQVNQVTNNQVFCNPSYQNINVNQTAYFSATGGSGQFTWSAPGANPSYGNGNSFSTNYNNSGSYTVTVSSNGSSDTCTVQVNQFTNNQVVCNPGFQTVSINQPAYFNASGGNGSYFWSAPGGNPGTGSGSSFSTSYSTGGSRIVTVTSGGNSANCSVNVNGVQGTNTILNYSKRATNDTKGTDAVSVRANKLDYITYTLTVTNNGSGTAENFVISDDLSQVLDKADLTDNGGGTLSGNVLSFSGVSIPAGGSVSKSFRVRVKSNLADSQTYVMTNTYGNTVNITIGTPQVLGSFIAPTTGAAGVSAVTFAGLLTLGFVAYRKRKTLLALILN